MCAEDQRHHYWTPYVPWHSNNNMAHVSEIQAMYHLFPSCMSCPKDQPSPFIWWATVDANGLQNFQQLHSSYISSSLWWEDSYIFWAQLFKLWHLPSEYFRHQMCPCLVCPLCGACISFTKNQIILLSLPLVWSMFKLHKKPNHSSIYNQYSYLLFIACSHLSFSLETSV